MCSGHSQDVALKPAGKGMIQRSIASQGKGDDTGKGGWRLKPPSPLQDGS